MRFSLKESTCVILLFIDIGLLTIFSRLAFGSWVPPVGDEGFWFYAAMLSLLLGSRLITPFYNKPVDVIAYAVAAVIALFLVNDWVAWSPDERMLFVSVTGFCGLAAAAAFLQIFIMDSASEALQVLSANLRSAIDVLDSPRVIYSLVILFSIYTFHRNAVRELTVAEYCRNE